jgi:hypothetical protein
MKDERFKLIREGDRGVRSSFFTREYIYRALREYAFNNNISKSSVINKCLEEFLRKQGCIDEHGRVTCERVR